MDILTTWNDKEAVLGKSQKAIVDGMRAIEQRLPFPLKGIDSDNGSEFINDHLWNFCRLRPPHLKVQFTRSRPYRKNDNAHIEQKNGSQVRQIIGYDRYDSPQAQKLMNDVYADLRIMNNLFQPSLKLLKKIHKGSRVIRRYDKPRT
ncbi:MAG: ISNCY family transposase, partial [Pseudonocardiaceae bacterium]